MAKHTVAALVAGIAASLSVSTAFAQTEITWWHAMGGELGTKLEEIVAGYNASQTDYKVMPVFKGTYPETMTAAIAAFRANEQPAHRAGLRSRHRHHDGRQGRHLSGLPADGRQGRGLRSRRPSCRPSSATTPTPTATSCRCRSTPRPRSCTTTRTCSRKPASTPRRRPRPGRRSRQFSQQIIESGAAPCGFTTGLDQLDPDREPLGLARPADRHAGERLRRPRHRAHRSTARCRSSTGTTSRAGRTRACSSMAARGGGDDAPPKFYAQECAIYMNSSAGARGRHRQRQGLRSRLRHAAPL